MKIAFTGGGTAGHIFPIIAVADEIKKLYAGEKELKLFYIGPKDKNTIKAFQERGIKVSNILAGKVRRYFSIKNLDILKMPIGFLQALCWCFWHNPDIIFSKGGFGSFPLALAALFLRVPLFLHESDAKAGLASRIQSKWALEVFTSFDKTEGVPAKKIICTGNPTRYEITQGNIEEAKIALKATSTKPVIVFMGGSLGAIAINNIVLDILPELLNSFEVIHQTGREHFKQAEKESSVLLPKEQKRLYHPLGFLNAKELKSALKIGSLIISRAGSGIVFEIAANGKPSILVPLPSSAQGHQVKNAYAFQDAGACLVLEQGNLKPHFLLEKIKNLFNRPDLMEQMAQSAADFSKPKAAWLIANYLLEYLYPQEQT